ncbi:MAG: NAD(P)/FAD-dependent oxidoreductase [Salinivirgaceae bacterium]|jgi:all-trans-retinol 13,14-reductase|nr:NAD(P)/FAD-dependent oxidoreductase [Salinivirgaceae bacterium]
MNYDIIVIGAGLGGLFAAAKLAKEGKKVLVIEQHDRPGGCATTFKRKEFTMEVGLHEMDGLDASDLKVKFFKDLGIFDEVEFLKVPEFYHFINGENEFTMPHDPEKAIELLITKFPEEEQGITSYFQKLLNSKKKNIDADHVEQNVGEYLDSIISNNDLKLILLGNLGYFHDDPYSLSLSYYTAAQGRYFKGGGNFIKGGSQQLSNYMVNFIKANNGEVLLNTMATSIITDNNKAIGVTYKPKEKPDTETIEAFADEIIANASIPAVANNLLPKKHGGDLALQCKNMPIGASLLTVYFGFKKSLKDCGSKYYSYFVYDELVKSQADILPNNKGDFKNRSFTFVDYSQVDSQLAPKGKSVGAVCCVDYPKDWENLDKDTYKAKKEKVAQIFINKLEKIIPEFKDNIEYYEVGTSKTVGRYILTPECAVYGFAQTPENVMKPKIETIENLHFASAWTKIGGGFSGAIYSGYLCAFGILRKRS